jgi:hypothetical protein
VTVKDIKSIIGYGSNPEGRPAKDFYVTPDIAVEKLLSVEKFVNPILEPACGDGAISEFLKTKGYRVVSSDLYDYGYGDVGADFLKMERPFTSIITNPPFNLAEEFVEKGLELTKPANGKLALLFRLSFLEGQKRKTLFENSPLKKVYVFSKRLTFTRPGDADKYSGMMAYAWFVWDWNYKGKPEIGWI